MGHGTSNAELAEKLTLREATVTTHVARIFAKLDLRDRARAVVLAYETGWSHPATRPDAAERAARHSGASTDQISMSCRAPRRT